MSSHAGISSGRSVSSASGGMTPSSFCRAKVRSRDASQPSSNVTLVLVRPLRPHVVRRVGRSRREVDEERLVGHQRLLLADPVDGVIGHVLGEVVALLRGAVGLDRHRVLVDRRRVLVRLAAEEAVEVLEARAGRPRVERAHGARLPDGNLVTLAELRRRVAVQLERLRERSCRVRPDGGVAGGRRRDLGDAAHADRVVVAAGEERLACGRAQGSRVEAVVLEPVGGEALGRGCRARPAERARRREADIVEEDDEHVRSTGGRPKRLDRRKRRCRILRVEHGRRLTRRIGDRELRAVEIGHAAISPDGSGSVDPTFCRTRTPRRQ